jgi:hypothetical protein
VLDVPTAVVEALATDSVLSDASPDRTGGALVRDAAGDVQNAGEANNEPGAEDSRRPAPVQEEPAHIRRNLVPANAAPSNALEWHSR